MRKTCDDQDCGFFFGERHTPDRRFLDERFIERLAAEA